MNFSNYIGLSYHHTEFNCWGLVCLFYKNEYEIDIPSITLADDNPKTAINTLANSQEKLNWVKVPSPKEGDVVLLRQSKHPIHVGVWLENDNGGVLHCLKGTGTIYQTLQNLSFMGWKVEGFYRYVKRNNS